MYKHGENFPVRNIGVFENRSIEGSEGLRSLQLLCYIKCLVKLLRKLMMGTAKVIFLLYFRRRYLPYEQREDGSDSSQSSLSALCFSTARNVERTADSTHVPLPLHIKLHDLSQY